MSISGVNGIGATAYAYMNSSMKTTGEGNFASEVQKAEERQSTTSTTSAWAGDMVISQPPNYSGFTYDSWKTLLGGKVTIEIYRLIEDALQDHLLSIEQKLKNIRDSVFYADLNCFSEGDLVRLKDFDGNEFAVNVSGWFCPERGSSNEVYVNWVENGINSVYGGIYISYGDYEMTEDDIPIPCVEDELVVKFSEVNDNLEAVVKGIMDVLDKIESQYVELEI